ncbi:MAG: hypothetical protein ACRDPY_07245 [Streptosporangiaceae bacterium]
MIDPLSPDRLTRLMHDAVQRVTVPPDTLDRIHQGVRRRRAVRHTGAAVLAAAVLAGGGVTIVAVASGGGAGPGATSSVGTGPVAAATPTSALADLAAPARIQPYLPPPSLSSVSGNNVGNGSGTTQQAASSTPPYREMPPAPSS